MSNDPAMLTESKETLVELVERLGALPKAPLAMPRQVLEYPEGRMAHWHACWEHWLRVYVLEP